MLTIIFIILFGLSGSGLGLAVRQNYKLKLEYNKLHSTFVETLSSDDKSLLLSSSPHQWTKLGVSDITDRHSKVTDRLISEKCTKCFLIRRYWASGIGMQFNKGPRMDGLFRFSQRFDEIDDREISCTIEYNDSIKQLIGV